MARGTTRITIRRSIGDVFAVLTDVESTGPWSPGNVEEHWTSLPPHGVGSTRHAVVTVLGRRTEDAVATGYQPPVRAVMQGPSPNAPFVVKLDFAPEGDGTRVAYGLAWGRGLASLKRLMESGEL